MGLNVVFRHDAPSVTAGERARSRFSVTVNGAVSLGSVSFEIHTKEKQHGESERPHWFGNAFIGVH